MLKNAENRIIYIFLDTTMATILAEVETGFLGLISW